MLVDVLNKLSLDAGSLPAISTNKNLKINIVHWWESQPSVFCKTVINNLMHLNRVKNLRLNTRTKEEVACQAATALNKGLEKLYQENKPILILLSGGSSFDILNYIDEQYLGDHSTIAVLDERYSTDPKENNFLQFQQTLFYSLAHKKNCKMVDTTVKAQETKEQLAERFQYALQEWQRSNPAGKIIATVGIGPDGHTSGILPFPENPKLFSELFENPEQLVVSYDAGDKSPYRYRVTTTITFMRDFIEYAIVYAIGENKRNALSHVIADSGSTAETPARILRKMKHVDLFTDLDL